MASTQDQTFQIALNEHKTGNLQEAERLYRVILQSEPKHPDANHNLGVIALAVGKVDVALPLFKAALSAKPQQAQFWVSLISALIKANLIDDAFRVLNQGRQLGLAEPIANPLEEKLISLRSKSSSSIPDQAKQAPSTKNTSPTQEEMDALLSLYRSGKLDLIEEQSLALTKKYPAHPFGWKVLGAAIAQNGRLKDALAPLAYAAKLAPNDAVAQSNLGNAFQGLGRLKEAQISYQESIRLNPKLSESHSNLGNVLQGLGKLTDAETSYREAIRLNPKSGDTHNNLGNTLKTLGRFTDAEASYREAIHLNPKSAGAHNNLGGILQILGRLSEAETIYRHAIRLQPEYADAHTALGNTLKDMERLDEAVISYQEAIRLKPDHLDALSSLGNLLKRMGRYESATKYYREAVRLKPDVAETHNNLASSLIDLGRFEEAAISCKEAIRLRPDFAEGYCNLGLAFFYLGRLVKAKEVYQKALDLNPELPGAYRNLGNILAELGEIAEAESCHSESTRLNPKNLSARSSLLFALNYDASLSASEIYQHYEAYGRELTSSVAVRYEHTQKLPPVNRRIRIGYSSPDFRGHACCFFMEPLFRHHDRSKFELFAYANVANPDEHTERLKGYFDHWVDVHHLNDAQMARRIFDDDIDILIDLAGHTRKSRITVFAAKPAPIQVASLVGYGYSTGLKEIDYLIGDEYITPEGCEPYFSERIWRIPAPTFCYLPPNTAPPVNTLPALTKGYITFGSLTRTIRLNDRLLGAWQKILDKVPGSRLRLDQTPFGDPETREFFFSRLERLGIPRDRVDLTYTKPHWNAYHDIDITLDCFPHNAGTTTIESLWMGVPVLTKLDRPSLGCLGAACLCPLGQEDWVAESELEYINKAVTFASDLSKLANLRSTLRSTIKNSALQQPDLLAKKLESSFIEMIKDKQGSL